MGVHVLEHPLISHKISLLRSKDTTRKEFRELAEEISIMLGYEATRNLPLKESWVETPITRTKSRTLADDCFALVPILRAGLGMAEGMLKIMPNAKVGHIGIYRDPQSLQPVDYFCKLPSDISKRHILLLDPMLATGGTASAAISFLKAKGAETISLLCIITCPEGIKKVSADHPGTDIYAAALDDGLNEHGYIVPGLGDAGDRIFGTE
jgi:uracil phosphoribosyltransferase